jgi:hypothetical protein
MKLINLIDHLKNLSKTEELTETELPNVEFGQIDTYLEGSMDIESEVVFFDAEKIPDDVMIEVNGIKYINLFPLPMLQEMVEEYHNTYGEKMQDFEIAKNILDYRIKDA